MCKRTSGFSLVEVAIALGIAAFVLGSVLALLALGINTNRISVEETRAAGILTMLEADLRNTYPASNSPVSSIYQIPLPYALNASNRIFNPSLTTNTLYTMPLNDSEQPTNFGSGIRPRYQASVVYTRLPANSLAPIEARLIVNWPGTNTANAEDLIKSPAGGYLEAVVSFPAP